jgi:hypothetical protein
MVEAMRMANDLDPEPGRIGRLMLWLHKASI